jgi:ribosome biogenesis GTPase A
MEPFPVNVRVWGIPKAGKTSLLNQLMEIKQNRLSSLCWEDETKSKFCFLAILFLDPF